MSLFFLFCRLPLCGPRDPVSQWTRGRSRRDCLSPPEGGRRIKVGAAEFHHHGGGPCDDPRISCQAGRGSLSRNFFLPSAAVRRTGCRPVRNFVDAACASRPPGGSPRTAWHFYFLSSSIGFSGFSRNGQVFFKKISGHDIPRCPRPDGRARHGAFLAPDLQGAREDQSDPPANLLAICFTKLSISFRWSCSFLSVAAR
jgi:hypothetical protein